MAATVRPRAAPSLAQTRRAGWAKRAQTETLRALAPHSRARSRSLSTAYLATSP
jgi:hypothetical protein